MSYAKRQGVRERIFQEEGKEFPKAQRERRGTKYLKQNKTMELT